MTAIATRRTWGTRGDQAVSGDFNGDGLDEFAIRRADGGSGQFHCQEAGITDGTAVIRAFGLAGDQPLVGDYNGDGRDEFAVWRAPEDIGEFHYQHPDVRGA